MSSPGGEETVRAGVKNIFRQGRDIMNLSGLAFGAMQVRFDKKDFLRMFAAPGVQARA
jgi:hypothetical protein